MAMDSMATDIRRLKAAEIEYLYAQIRAMTTFAEKYSVHHSSCERLVNDGKCNCGLIESRKALLIPTGD